MRPGRSQKSCNNSRQLRRGALPPPPPPLALSKISKASASVSAGVSPKQGLAGGLAVCWLLQWPWQWKKPMKFKNQLETSGQTQAISWLCSDLGLSSCTFSLASLLHELPMLVSLSKHQSSNATCKISTSSQSPCVLQLVHHYSCGGLVPHDRRMAYSLALFVPPCILLGRPAGCSPWLNGCRCLLAAGTGGRLGELGAKRSFRASALLCPVVK